MNYDQHRDRHRDQHYDLFSQRGSLSGSLSESLPDDSSAVSSLPGALPDGALSGITPATGRGAATNPAAAPIGPAAASAAAATDLSSRARRDVGRANDAGRAIPEALQPIINRRDTWIGQGGAANNDEHAHPHLATGFAALDERLCEDGWPLGTCIEVLTDASGMGAMGLFLPAMESLSPQQRWQAFIAPPYTPYAPLLAARDIDTRQVLLVHPRNREEQLWSTEQALRSGTCSAVFSWLGGGSFRYAELRRLQLAAARGDTLAVLFRPREAAHQHAPASLRLQMEAYREVRILKQRSGLQDINVYLPPEDDIPHQPQLWELPQDHAPGTTRAVS